MDSCKANEGTDQPFEKSWLFQYHELMAREEKSKANEKNAGSDANRAANGTSKSEAKKTKSSSKRASKTLIPLSGSIDIKDLHQLQPEDFKPGGQGFGSSRISSPQKESGLDQNRKIDMKALEVHLNIKKPAFLEKKEKLNEDDDLFLEKVKEMTEYYMEVDRVLGKMGTHLEAPTEAGPNSMADQDVEMKPEPHESPKAAKLDEASPEEDQKELKASDTQMPCTPQEVHAERQTKKRNVHSSSLLLDVETMSQILRIYKNLE